MKLTAQVKLLPSREQAKALRDTLEKANAACNHISEVAWRERIFGQFALHRLTYHCLRGQFGLSAQVIVRCIAKVADAYKLDRKSRRIFRPAGAISYDSRILRWRLSSSEVSIWTVAGRQTIPFVCGDRQRALLTTQQGESDLAVVEGKWYLFAVCNVEGPEPGDVGDFLGVDMGVANIAADSDGRVYSGAVVNGLRHRHRRLRSKLQKKGTKSAKRLLRKRHSKESRFARHENHCISKEIVAAAEGTKRGIALEELTGIRSRITARRPQRATLSSWSFAQLRSFIEYKARRAGVTVIAVDPRNTSRTCPACGYTDKANRPEQSIFSCVQCGFSGPADTIAAENIRRAAIRLPNAAGIYA